MPDEHVILHIDMDAFYASIEQRDRPEIRSKPVIVGADPQGGQGRGVVAAASYEAREYGVRSAMPISRAWRACPNGVYLRPRHGYYAEVSDQVFELVEDHVDVLEQTSIDEAYADVTRTCRGLVGRASQLAKAIKAEVADRFDLTCSVGIGPSKLVAKVASDQGKPDGLTVVEPDEVQAFLAPMDVRVIPGVGPKTGQSLADRGVETVEDLARADPAALEEAFGVWGPRMVALARGHDDRPVEPGTGRKSVGTETTFAEDLAPEQARRRVPGVAREAADRLRSTGEQGRTVTLKLRTGAFETTTRARTLAAPTDDPDALERVALGLFEALEPEEPVRLIGLRVSNLVSEGPVQASLDRWPADVLGEAQPPEPEGARRWRFF